MHAVAAERVRALMKFGTAMAANIPIIATISMISSKVKALAVDGRTGSFMFEGDSFIFAVLGTKQQSLLFVFVGRTLAEAGSFST